jgi:uncharacterized protein YdhG (YjbR/CyaY superfamily)
MAARPHDIDAYLARLESDKRATLQKLRRDIAAAAPGAEECISYGIPTFRLNGRMLVSFGVGARHCAFYPGALPIRTLARALAAYNTSIGTIRFPPGRPLPATLVRRLVKARIAEHEARKSTTRRK